MKKRIVIAFLAIIGLTAGSCTSDDNSSSSNYQKDIQQIWVESKSIILDKNKKVILEGDAFNEDGCDLSEIEFKGDQFFMRESYKPLPNSECITDEDQGTFKIYGNNLVFTLDFGKEEDMEMIDSQEIKIIEITKTKLVIQQKIDKEDLEDYPKNAVYVQAELRKK